MEMFESLSKGVVVLTIFLIFDGAAGDGVSDNLYFYMYMV